MQLRGRQGVPGNHIVGRQKGGREEETRPAAGRMHQGRVGEDRNWETGKDLQS